MEETKRRRSERSERSRSRRSRSSSDHGRKAALNGSQTRRSSMSAHSSRMIPIGSENKEFRKSEQRRQKRTTSHRQRERNHYQELQIDATNERLHSSTGCIEQYCTFVEAVGDLSKTKSDRNLMENATSKSSHSRSNDRDRVRALCKLLYVSNDINGDSSSHDSTTLSREHGNMTAKTQSKTSHGDSCTSASASAGSSSSKSSSNCSDNQARADEVQDRFQQLCQDSTSDKAPRTREPKRRKSHGSLDEILKRKTKPIMKRSGSCRDINRRVSFSFCQIDRRVDAGSTPTRSRRRSSLGQSKPRKELMELATTLNESNVDNNMDAIIPVGLRGNEADNNEAGLSKNATLSTPANWRPTRRRSIMKHRTVHALQRQISSGCLNMDKSEENISPPFSRSSTAPNSLARYTDNLSDARADTPSYRRRQRRNSGSHIDTNGETMQKMQSDKVNMKTLMAAFDWRELSESGHAKSTHERTQSSSTPSDRGKQRRDGSKISSTKRNGSGRGSRRSSIRRSVLESRRRRSTSRTRIHRTQTSTNVQQRRSSERGLLLGAPKLKRRSSSAPSVLDVSAEDLDHSLDQRPAPLRRKSLSGNCHIGCSKIQASGNGTKSKYSGLATGIASKLETTDTTSATGKTKRLLELRKNLQDTAGQIVPMQLDKSIVVGPMIT
ncbi:expressed unknown protein [Seminavis robusta]|uniref:Uncharacterized protein n=1 Tax=Seminavis robusta TaxID=568900 RepID=A0A9N8F222_9STRA|nr:expressed unknown protein [Seminavis robusta]|eukprot:Sro2726_g335670.1 n/a (667) ;mRNA; r:8897-10897